MIRRFSYFFLVPVFLLNFLHSHPIDVTDTTIEIREDVIEIKSKVPMAQVRNSFSGGLEKGMTISQKRSQILSYIRERVVFFRAQKALEASTMSLHFLKTPGQNLPYMEVRSTTPLEKHDSLSLRNTLFFETSPLQKNLITIYSKDGIDRHIATVSEYEFNLLRESPPSSSTAPLQRATSSELSSNPSPSFLPFISMGIHHILIGWVHIAFLLGILLMVRGIKNLVWVVTSFTLAHSLTLFLAAMGWLALPVSLTESLIALTIVWIGLENLCFANTKSRWKLTFLLGLIHGVGFAYTFETTGIFGWDLLFTVLSFNLGVEIGQLLIVLLVFPLFVFLSKREKWNHILVTYGSIFLIILGTYWFLQRVNLIA